MSETSRCALPSREARRTPGSRRTERSGRAGSAAAGAARPRWTRHSRRVALLKRVLPVIGVALLLLIAMWPRLAPLWERMRVGFPAIDLRDAQELQMVNPRYAGVDRDRPPVRRDRRLRPADPRSAGSDVAAGAARRRQDAWRRRYRCHRRQRRLSSRRRSCLTCSTTSRVSHQNGTRFVTQSARVNAAHQHRQGQRPGRGAWPRPATSRRRDFAFSTRATRSYSPAGPRCC